MKKILMLTIGGGLTLTVVVALLLIAVHLYITGPIYTHRYPVILEIPPGQTFETTVRKLVDANVILSPIRFTVYARYKGYDKQLKAGEYTIEARISPQQILEKIANGQVTLHRITVPEGFNLAQIDELLAIEGIISARGTFSATARNSEVARALKIEGPTCEGYLFPDTYYFAKNVNPLTIVQTMVSHFWKKFKPQWNNRSNSFELSIREAVILASIIEKETGNLNERPLISSVFHNRLKNGMRLQSDPTVIYGLTNFDGNLTRTHLQNYTPFNTYLINGLPPSPISNPGMAALKAALFPAETQFMYFVSKNDTTHHFSTNLTEHAKAVRQYQANHP